MVVVVLALAVPPTLSWMAQSADERADQVNSIRAITLAQGVLENIMADSMSASAGLGFSAFANSATYVDTPTTGLRARLSSVSSPYESLGFSYSITIGALMVLPMIPMWVFYAHGMYQFMAAVFALQFCVQGAWGVVPAHLNELSPGDVRGTFPGFVYQVGNLLSAVVPYSQTFLVEHHQWQYGQALALVAVGAALTIAVLVNLGPEGRHVNMSGEESAPAK